MKRFLSMIWKGFKLVFVLILLSSITLGYCYSETKFDGYLWEEMDNKYPVELVKGTKLFFIKGYLLGIKTGRMDGYVDGFYSGAKYTYDEFEKLILKQYKKPLNEPEGLTSFLQKRNAGLKVIAEAVKELDLMNESAEYYLKELDSFLKTYPMCKREEMFALLGRLSGVWSKKSAVTYKDIGEECLKPKE